MLQQTNATTFTSQHSLREAHLERKKSDAILTGIGTVIRDYPKFNVRYLKDHENRKRIIVVLSDDQREPPQPWLEQEWNLGLEVLVYQDFDQAIQMLGELGVHRVLVEAGPTLSKFVEEKQLWDERIVFLQADPQDIIYRELHPTHQ